jgi:hypothetical protein
MIGAKTLEQELKNWDELLELCSLVLESATWLLWHHMEHFFQHKRSLAFGGSTSILSQEEFGRLKKEAPIHLNTILFKKMNECEQVFTLRELLFLSIFLSPITFSLGLSTQKRSSWFCSSPSSAS